MFQLGADDPRTIGSYEIVGKLGEGGMGTVYKGRSRGGRSVAVKVAKPELAADPDFRARFRTEIEAAQRVGGFHTAQVIDADPDANPPWMTTAFIPGRTLAGVVGEDGPMDEERLRALGAALAEALQAIHGNDLVHRDLKPANIILSDDGPRVLDFGIARALEATRFTHTHVSVGTPGFFSPEQVEGGRDIGPPADVFALGAVLVHAAGGRPFGEGDSMTLMYRAVHNEPVLTALPEPLRPLVAACMEKEPERRPTPEDILVEVTAHRGHGPDGGDGQDRGLPAPAPAPAPAPVPASASASASASAAVPAAPAPGGGFGPAPSTFTDMREEAVAERTPAPETREPVGHASSVQGSPSVHGRTAGRATAQGPGERSSADQATFARGALRRTVMCSLWSLAFAGLAAPMITLQALHENDPGSVFYEPLPLVIPVNLLIGVLLCGALWALFPYRVTLDAEGIAYRKGPRTVRCAWAELAAVELKESSLVLRRVGGLSSVVCRWPRAGSGKYKGLPDALGRYAPPGIVVQDSGQGSGQGTPVGTRG